MVKCEICGKEFEAISWKHLRSHGLTMDEYRALGHRTGTEKGCEICGEMFVPGNRKQRFCGRDCADVHKSRTYRGASHPSYGRTFEHTPEARAKIKKNNAKYWLGKKRPGIGRINAAKHKGRYKGRPCDNSVDENMRDRKNAENKRWVRAVKKRDNYTCQVCFAADKPIVAHHIWPFRKFKGLRFALHNGITLCDDCHEETYGREIELVNRFGWRMEMPIVGLHRSERVPGTALRDQPG